MDYVKTTPVVNGITTGLAQQYNSLMTELKMAMMGVSSHPVTMALTYSGGTGNDLLSSITITDGDGVAGDTNISGTVAYTYNGSDQISTVVYTFTNQGIIITETYSYTGDNITGIAVTLS